MSPTPNRSKDQQGFAMITTLLIMVVVTTLISGSLAYSLNSLAVSRHDQDWNAALAAAQSGADDYLFRVNQNANYWQYGLPPATCPATPVPPSAPCPKAPPDGNQAFQGYVTLPGSPNDARFRYDVDASTIKVDDIIKLKVTGLVRKVTRSLQVTIKQNSFLNYLFLTNYETEDPASYNGYPFSPANAALKCTTYLYATPSRDPNCLDPVWAYSVMNGPVHSNDSLQMWGGTPRATFNGPVTTSWADPAGKFWVDAYGGANPLFNGGNPAYHVKVDLPPSNQNIKAQADPIFASAKGCLFTGPTSIVLKNTSMDVISPDTKFSNCKSVAPDFGNGQPYAGVVTLPLPPAASGVIYVQSVPTSSGDPNFPASGVACSMVGNKLGYPVAGDNLGITGIDKYMCNDGDAFVSGTLQGQLTIGTDNNIYAVGNIRYSTPPPAWNGAAGTGSDVLGLVAKNSVEIYHPVHWDGLKPITGITPPIPCPGDPSIPGCDSTAANVVNLDGTPPTGLDGVAQFGNTSGSTAIVQGAMASLLHSFTVQNYQWGSPIGTLQLNGALAQKFRGAVGVGGSSISHGYVKDYNYDPRLAFLTPPFFIAPVSSAWGIHIWAEIPAVYGDGPTMTTVPVTTTTLAPTTTTTMAPITTTTVPATTIPPTTTTIPPTTTTTIPPLTCTSSAIADGALFAYPLNEASGTTANGVTTPANPGTYTGSGVTYSQAGPCPRDSAKSVQLNGSTGYVSGPGGSSQAGTNVFTEEVWFKTTTVSGGKLMGFGTSLTGSSGSYDRQIYMDNSGHLFFGVFPGTAKTIQSAGTYNNGAWHHVAATLSPGGMLLYVDGAQVAADATTTTGQSYSGFWRIGYDNTGGWPGSPTSNFFSGNLAYAAVYTSALSPTRILAHRNSGI